MKNNIRTEMKELEELASYVNMFYRGNQSEAAAALGLKPSTLNKWLSCDRTPSYRLLKPVLEKVRSEISENAKTGQVHWLAPHAVNPPTQEKLTTIGIYEVAGAGPGWDIAQYTPICIISIPPAFAHKADFAFIVKGESMHPTIKDGAIIGVKRDVDFVNNEVYAIQVPYEGLSIKRVFIDYKSEEYVIRSDNPDKEKYGDIKISMPTAPDLIIGKAVWLWQGM